jgi:thiamine biosynthesis lipoprotein
MMIMFISSLQLSGCTVEPMTCTGYKLNTYVSVTAYTKTTKDVLNQCLSLCDYYEKMFSRVLKESTLYKVNHQEITEIPEELARLIQYGIDYSKLSGGAFDVAIGSVSDLWDFTSEHPTVPDSAAIANALQYVDYTKIKLDKLDNGSYRIQMPEHTMIDLGAIAKGYIADRLKDFLLEKGVTRAVINLGGNVLCVGGKTSNTAFAIGVKKPFSDPSKEEAIASLMLSDKSAVSSGTYERYFYDENGNFYHHILNPNTGYPYDNSLTDVTIISDESVIGDCLSTTCYVLGLEEGMKLVESLDGIEAMFVTTDGKIHYSSGFSKYLAK